MINWNTYPYTDFHELNLDWILSVVKSLDAEMDAFVNVNTIKYADPLTWDITTQYEQNTLVQDANGNTFLSKIPVPKGIALGNEEYWLKVADFSGTADVIRKSIALANDGASTTSSADRVSGDLVWLNGDLYKVIREIENGDRYVIEPEENPNVERITIEELLADLESRIIDIVEPALEEIENDIATEVNDRTEADNTINERIDDEIDARESAFETLNKSITNVETLVTTLENTLSKRRIIHVRDFGAVGDGVTDDTDAIQAAFNYVADNLLKTVVMDPGRYHTTRPLTMPPYLYVTCESYCDACFLDTFPQGTIQLNNGCWIDNVLFLDDRHPGHETYAIYGTDIVGVSITRVQMSGATIGSSEVPTSGFLKLIGNWTIIMVKDCLVDAGGSSEFAFHIAGQDNWDPSIHPYGDRDIFIRDCFLDNFQPRENLGGLFYINSIKDLRLHGCICRSSSNTFVLANTHTNQECNVYASNCLIERSTTNGYCISIGAGCSFENLGSVIGKTSYIINDGKLVQYDTSNATFKTLPSPSQLIADGGVSVNRQGNGSLFLEHVASGIEDNVGASFGVAVGKFVRAKISYYGSVCNESRYGYTFNDGTNDIRFYVNPFNNTLFASRWNGNTYVSDIIAPVLINTTAELELGMSIENNRVVFFISYDGIYWKEIVSYNCIPPTRLKIFGNDGVASSKFVLQINSLDVG